MDELSAILDRSWQREIDADGEERFYWDISPDDVGVIERWRQREGLSVEHVLALLEYVIWDIRDQVHIEEIRRRYSVSN